MNTIIEKQEITFEEEVQQLVANQRAYFKSNATQPVEFRLSQLRKLKALLIEHENEMHEAIFKRLWKI